MCQNQTTPAASLLFVAEDSADIDVCNTTVGSVRKKKALRLSHIQCENRRSKARSNRSVILDERHQGSNIS